VDSNGTRYHLLLGEGDWGECTDASGLPLRAHWAASVAKPKGIKVKPPRNTSGLAWNEERHELTLQPRLFKFVAAPDDTRPEIENRRGAARDRYGNWYWIDETRRRVCVNSSGTKRTTDFWPAAGSRDCADESRGRGAGEFRPVDPDPVRAPVFAGLAVTEDHYLVAGTVEPRGILVFDLHAGGAPQQLLWPAGVRFEPFDMAARPGGGVFILDRLNRRYWELDRSFSVVLRSGKWNSQPQPPTLAPFEDDFYPVEAGEGQRENLCQRRARIMDDDATELYFPEPVAIESLPDGSVLVLASRPGGSFARVHRFQDGRRLGKSVSTNSMLGVIEEDRQDDFTLLGYDFAFVAAQGDGAAGDRLYVVAADGNQSYAFSLTWRGRVQLKLKPEPVYLPMRLFGGKGLVGAGERAHYDSGGRWLPLVEQRRPRYASEAVLQTPAAPAPGEPSRVFDGGEPGCVWHRLMLDACLPAGTRVEVWSRAADNAEDLPSAEWMREPAPYLRVYGSELPFVGRLNARTVEAARARAEGAGTWELLFQHARGRYAQLRLRLSGDERGSPRLRALRAYYGRFSYAVNYLPGVYREDEQSASFLDRFLANHEGYYTSLEDKIASVQALFDVRSAPADTLDWLANWFGVALDPAWDEERRRLFIKHAMHFFQWRGTRHGLELALRLVSGEEIDDAAFALGCCGGACPPSASAARGVRIVEAFRARHVPGVLVGDPTDAAGPGLLAPAGSSRWKPAQRGETLHRLYREQLGLGEGELYPVRDPGGARSSAWRDFSLRTLGFVPEAADSDAALWQDFLRRRYRSPARLADAYLVEVASFADVPVPAALPGAGPALYDWFEFESLVLLTHRFAHRFTVLLPVPGTETFDSEAQRARRDLTRRIVELEKPAHTVFDIRFYWAMFRVGYARLGDDTVVDLGGRAPALMPPMVLDREHLAESYLAAAHPQSVAERAVVGRGRPRREA
jgi:phage tail-like protein